MSMKGKTFKILFLKKAITRELSQLQERKHTFWHGKHLIPEMAEYG